ncbi:MAG TPA: SRPBCC family protein [Myxococcaceae bacterium]|nr:SRPBCC family protein [Myxococcaceae bacterium]
MIAQSVEFDVAKPPSEVFAILDDFNTTPRWNSRCVEVKQVSPGPHQKGAQLLYVYRDPGRQGKMDGVISAYDPGRALELSFSDRTMDIAVGFRLEPNGAGTRVQHQLQIEPRSFLARLMTPIIRGATRKQTEDSVQRLKALLS